MAAMAVSGAGGAASAASVPAPVATSAAATAATATAMMPTPPSAPVSGLLRWHPHHDDELLVTSPGWVRLYSTGWDRRYQCSGTGVDADADGDADGDGDADAGIARGLAGEPGGRHRPDHRRRGSERLLLLPTTLATPGEGPPRLLGELPVGPAHLRCSSWYHGTYPARTVAIGTADGGIVLAAIATGDDAVAARFGTVRVLEQRSGRPVTALAFHPVYHHFLASAAERARNDTSLRIWDVNRLSPIFLESADNVQVAAQWQAVLAPSDTAKSDASVSGIVHEWTLKDSVHSMAWFSACPQLLAHNCGGKAIQVRDLRTRGGVVKSITSCGKSVEHLCTSPHAETVFASVSTHDGLVKIWDLRDTLKPLLSIPSAGGAAQRVLDMQFCPTRRGRLSLLRADATVCIWDLAGFPVSAAEHAVAGGDGSGAAGVLLPGTERMAAISASDAPPWLAIARSWVLRHTSRGAASFDWHPRRIGEVALLRSDAAAVVLRTARELPTVAILPQGRVILASAARLLEMTQVVQAAGERSAADTALLADVSSVMRERAIAGYSVKPLDNIPICRTVSGSPALVPFWQQVEHLQRTNVGNRMLCLDTALSLLQPAGSIMASADPEYRGTLPLRLRVYRSEGRRLVLQRCQRDLTTDTLETLVARSVPPASAPRAPHHRRPRYLTRCRRRGRHELEHAFDHAALIALYMADLPRAIRALETGAKHYMAVGGEDVGSQLLLAAVALGGYMGPENELWHETTGRLAGQLRRPHLRALFAFLAAYGDETRLLQLLDQDYIDLYDRLAIACQLLDDRRLQQFIQARMRAAIAKSDLGCIFITGLGNEGIALLQSYVDATGDVQTAALATARLCAQSPAVQRWVSVYRKLLDRWQLWHQRAHFDIQRRIERQAEMPPQIFVRCNFCNSSIHRVSLYDRAAGRAGSVVGRHASSSSSSGAGGPPSLAPLAGCPTCKRPLPRCVLCLMPMGTPSRSSLGGQAAGTGDADAAPQQAHSSSGGVEDWFAWCQTCRHGGHAGHLLDWFRDRAVCPVAGCQCRCANTALVPWPPRVGAAWRDAP